MIRPLGRLAAILLLSAQLLTGLGGCIDFGDQLTSSHDGGEDQSSVDGLDATGKNAGHPDEDDAARVEALPFPVRAADRGTCHSHRRLWKRTEFEARSESQRP